MDLSTFRALTFDVYGTLIDWESGMLAELRPWAARHGVVVDNDGLLNAFAAIELRWETEHPTLLYADLLGEVHQDLARHYGVPVEREAARAFGQSILRWPAFDDSAAALAILQRYYRLCILSNVDNRSLASTLPRLTVRFDAIYTAQDIGSYKPALRNFTHALDRLAADGIGQGELLHVGQSLLHDHEPAAQLHIASCWIDRRAGRANQGAVMPVTAMPLVAFRFDSLSAFASAVQQAFDATTR